MILITVVSLVFPAVYSQDRDQLKDQAEEILHQDENSRIPVEVLEEYQEMTGYPVNLNTATPEELGATRLFTSFQVHMFIEYREQYGELLSIYELASITGFRISRLKEIAPYITVTNSTRIIRRHTTSNRMLLFAGRSFPDALGQGSREPGVKEPVYAGSPLHTSLRLKMALGKYTELGLVYGKDPGEKGFRGIRPEYLAGYIHYRGRRILEQVVLGSFRLHNGLGLIQGGNLFNAPSTFNSRPLLLSSLRPYAGLIESGPHRGVAFRINLRPVKVTLWSSLQPMDLSVGDLLQETGETDWVAYRRHTGLHRTPVEQGGYNLGYLAHAGIQAMVYRKNLAIGAQFSSEI
ncbi:MAG: helix-hairpin-helix domain-containing protein, partial [Bacteroidales bacterium]|nr:helix-hairpin-helix domain-containing protein [Bacteroidales bacterium]